MPDFLIVSIVLSVVLTVVLNLGLRLFPGAGRRAGDTLDRWMQPGTEPSEPSERERRSRVRVFFPWRAMLLGSIVLTIVLNVLIAVL